ncbi:MAG: hypothetical protein ACI9W2_000150 [Gammaproteobacteria bacterium]
MQAALSYLFSFPVGILSVLLLAVLAYWALVIVGAFDIEMFDFDGDPDTGGVDGWWGSLGLVGGATDSEG